MSNSGGTKYIFSSIFKIVIGCVLICTVGCNISDKSEAKHPAKWTWLLHNDKGLKIDPDKKTIVAENELANALVSLYSSTDIDFNVTDKFDIPARNWNRKIDQDGNLIDFVDQWHFSGISKEKKPKMRYLAIIQVNSKTGESNNKEVVFNKNTNTYTVGEWNINAEMDVSKSAKIEIYNDSNTAAFTSSGKLLFKNKSYNGKVQGSSKLIELIDGKLIFKDAVDEVPNAIKKVSKRFKDEKN